MFIKRKRKAPGGSSGSGSEQEERQLENPEINDILDEIDSTLKSVEQQKQKQKKLSGDCGCWGNR